MKDELTQFLNHIWGDGGRVFLAYKSAPGSWDVPPPRQWPRDSEKIINFIFAVSAKQRDVYYAPAIYKQSAVNKTSENVSHSHCLWVEFDGNSAEGLAKLRADGLPAPTYRVQSSYEGHEHWYWILEKPAITSVFEPLNKKLTYSLNADKSGWDAAQVLRPPFTRNYKPEKKSVLPVDIVEFTGEIHAVESFGELPSVNHSIVETNSKLGDLPTIGEVLGKYNWDDKHLDLFNNPPDVKGSRDQSLMRMAHFCAEVGMTDEAMYVILDDVSTRLGKFVGRADRERRAGAGRLRA